MSQSLLTTYSLSKNHCIYVQNRGPAVQAVVNNGFRPHIPWVAFVLKTVSARPSSLRPLRPNRLNPEFVSRVCISLKTRRTKSARNVALYSQVGCKVPANLAGNQFDNFIPKTALGFDLSKTQVLAFDVDGPTYSAIILFSVFFFFFYIYKVKCKVALHGTRATLLRFDREIHPS